MVSGTDPDVVPRVARQRARDEYDGIVQTFEGTSLEAKAKALRDQFVAKVGGAP